MTADESAEILHRRLAVADIKRYLPCAVRASRAGVGRVHLIGFEQDGALLRELFTRDGVGTVVTRESLENIREAKPDDIAPDRADRADGGRRHAGAPAARTARTRNRPFLHHAARRHHRRLRRALPHSGEEAELACLAVIPSTANGATASS
jgi:amino-acid N-acetyltransferase